MSFIAIPTGINGQPLHRKTPHSSVHETKEAAMEWASKYIENRRSQIAAHAKKGKRRSKRLTQNFARLDRVIIYEDVGAIFVNPTQE